MLSSCLDADYRPIMAIHHKLRQENIHIYDELAADKFFSIRMIGVENSQRGMGVATELIRRLVMGVTCDSHHSFIIKDLENCRFK